MSTEEEILVEGLDMEFWNSADKYCPPADTVPYKAESTIKKLDDVRQELLHLGLRANSLLNLKLSAKTLEVVDESASEVFNILVNNQNTMSFIATPFKLSDESDQHNQSQEFSKVFKEIYSNKRYTGTGLQTQLSTLQLDKKLLIINTQSTSYYQEHGVDLLYLALGFLHWYENKNSDLLRKAPLILIPVSLERSTVREQFHIKYTQADLTKNLILAAKLKKEFGITLPEFCDELDIERYFSRVRKIIKNQPDWKVVENEIVLGFFSFKQFQMYQDLDHRNWPEGVDITEHPIIKTLVGDEFNNELGVEWGNEKRDYSIYDKTDSNKTIPLETLHIVYDADASQTEAIMSVKKGTNLVIQGPPGSGKSQTITNIIAESLADNKKLLFVSEKMAALEVVKKRLDECHLGSAVLELHSHKNNKQIVVEELKRTLDFDVSSKMNRTIDKRKYIQQRNHLNQYCRDVNLPILNSGISYIDAMGYYLKCQKTKGNSVLPKFNFEPMKKWNNKTYRKAFAHTKTLVEHLESIGVPANNPFAKTKLTHFNPTKKIKLKTLLSESTKLLSTLRNQANILSHQMGLNRPNTITEIHAIHKTAVRAINVPHLTGIDLTTAKWQAKKNQCYKLLKIGSALSSLKKKYEYRLSTQAWDTDLTTTRQVMMEKGDKWWCLLSGDFRKAKNTLQDLYQEALPNNHTSCIEILDDILQYQKLYQVFKADEPLGAALFGVRWQGENSQWDVLIDITKWLVALYDEIAQGAVSKIILQFLKSGKSIEQWKPKLKSLSNINKILENKILIITRLLKIYIGQDNNVAINNLPLNVIEKSLRTWESRIDEIDPILKFNRLKKSLHEVSLLDLAILAYRWKGAPRNLLLGLQNTWYEGLICTATKERKSLRQFDRINHENILKEFKWLDRNLMHYARESLALKHYRQLPGINSSDEMAIICKEMNKKRCHMPIRKLIDQTGKTIQQIKPIFMMSPMSIATYLVPKAVDFDLVIFDEASQIKVVDALGAIARAKQVVVVGDTKQMLPSDHFVETLELDDEKIEENEMVDMGQAADMDKTRDTKSILGMLLLKGVTEKVLRWHYRSQQESLIAVSNQEFYDRKLMLYPSPGVNPQASGIKFNHLPNSIYERGASRTNPMEARHIAEKVMDHARHHPELSLGVVALSAAQRDCIYLEIEKCYVKTHQWNHFSKMKEIMEKHFSLKILKMSRVMSVMLSISA